MIPLFAALQDTTGWTVSLLPSGPEDARVLVHRSGLRIDARFRHKAWKLFRPNPHSRGVPEYLLDIPQHTRDKQNLLADLDLAFGPAGQARLAHLVAVIWHWALTTQDVELHEDIVLLRHSREIGITFRSFVLPNRMWPLFKATEGVVGFDDTPGNPGHGMGLSSHLMIAPGSVHERLLRMQPPVALGTPRGAPTARFILPA